MLVLVHLPLPLPLLLLCSLLQQRLLLQAALLYP